MLAWLLNNIWTIIICAVLIGIVAAIIISMVRKKSRANQSSATAATAKAALCTAHVINNK